MNRPDLTRMTKVEVVVGATDVPAVRAVFQAAGASGFTSVSAVSGLGHDGYHQGRLLFNQQGALELLITVVADDALDGLLAGLGPLLEERPGVMFVSDTYVSRPEYFA